jgi:hypothetical protein
MGASITLNWLIERGNEKRIEEEINRKLAGCLDHVTDGQINRLQTDAARFARGDLWQCLSDAGPFCANRLARMEADENEPDG